MVWLGLGSLLVLVPSIADVSDAARPARGPDSPAVGRGRLPLGARPRRDEPVRRIRHRSAVAGRDGDATPTAGPGDLRCERPRDRGRERSSPPSRWRTSSRCGTSPTPSSRFGPTGGWPRAAAVRRAARGRVDRANRAAPDGRPRRPFDRQRRPRRRPHRRRLPMARLRRDVARARAPRRGPDRQRRVDPRAVRRLAAGGAAGGRPTATIDVQALRVCAVGRARGRPRSFTASTSSKGARARHCRIAIDGPDVPAGLPGRRVADRPGRHDDLARRARLLDLPRRPARARRRQRQRRRRRDPGGRPPGDDRGRA